MHLLTKTPLTEFNISGKKDFGNLECILISQKN